MHFYCIARLNDVFEWEQLTALKPGVQGYEYYSEPEYFEHWCNMYPNTVVEIVTEEILDSSSVRSQSSRS